MQYIGDHMKQLKGDIILNAAIAFARKPGGWMLLTRRGIAEAADCSEGLVSRYLGDMPHIRATIIGVAIREEILEIIAQSVAASDGYLVQSELKQKAIESLLG